MERVEEEPRLRRGEAVGRYVVLQLVGQGAMGEVYKAHDTALDRSVALKVLTVAPGDRQLEESIAVREGQMLARVQHPGVVAVYDVGVHPPSTFIALEFVEGTSLADAIAQGGLDASKVGSIARQLADGLVAVHEAGLIHRDIKPGNILIDEAGSARLADLGVAKLVIDMGPEQDGAGATWVGTPGYRAPEVEAGEPTTRAADVYSLCAALCEAAPEAPTREWRSLLRALQRGTDEEPARRPTAAELAAALNPKPRNWLWLAGAASIAAAVVVGTQRDDPEAAVDHLAAAELRLQPVWSPDVKSRLETWADAPASGEAGEGWTKRETVRVLEQRARGWKQASADVAALGSPEEVALHQRCLDVALARLAGAVELTLAREGSAGPLLAWIHELPVAGACLRGDLHRRRFAGWDEGDPTQHLADLERLLRADGAIHLGNEADARAVIDELAGRGDLGVLHGYLAYLQGILAFRTRGSPAEAIQSFRKAIVAAETHGDRLLAARATLELSRKLVLTGGFDEARFVVERAMAGLGPQPGAELLTVRLLDGYSNIEGGLGSEQTQAEVRRRLEEIESRIDPDGYEAFYLHAAWAQLSPDHAEEHELAAWQLASVHVGPTHDLTMEWRERYVRRACARWSAAVCTRHYQELYEALPGRERSAVLLTTEAFALSQAGHDGAAWELRFALQDAVGGTDKPAQKLIGSLCLAGLAMADRMGSGVERLQTAEAAVDLIASLGAPQHLAGAEMLAARVAADLGDRDRAELHLRAIETPPLQDPVLHRYARAHTRLALGDSRGALEDLEALQRGLEAAKNSPWVEKPQVTLALCVASFRAGSLEQVTAHCSRAAQEPALSEEERERAMGRIALRGLERP